MDIQLPDHHPLNSMSEGTQEEARSGDHPHPPGEGRPMHVDYFAVLSTVMAILLMLSQAFVLVWLDLL